MSGLPRSLTFPFLRADAVFSPCRKWRYLLKRRWTCERPWMAIVGLNPSTADESTDDPTVRRCIGFARDLGYGGIQLVNLFAYRSTDPKPLKVLHKCEVVGPENDGWMEHAFLTSGVVVAAWGVHGSIHGRDTEVMLRWRDWKCFGRTKGGAPRHPLYLPRSTQLQPLAEREEGFN